MKADPRFCHLVLSGTVLCLLIYNVLYTKCMLIKYNEVCSAQRYTKLMNDSLDPKVSNLDKHSQHIYKNIIIMTSKTAQRIPFIL